MYVHVHAWHPWSHGVGRRPHTPAVVLQKDVNTESESHTCSVRRFQSSWRSAGIMFPTNKCLIMRMCVLYKCVFLLQSVCLHVCWHDGPVGGFGCSYMFILGFDCVCVCVCVRLCVTEQGAGRGAAPLRGRVLFGRRLRLSSRCQTSCWCARCQSHGDGMARSEAEGRSVCVCARWRLVPNRINHKATKENGGSISPGETSWW